ncbi:MAG: hypothetical protein JXB45_08180 [Candidatus Krumholzibacteriota bacterium]|nr:hypothetical protein [Candidatus Krumholzibacteriota bacterium]
MIIDKILKAISKNLGAKIVSLIFAIFLWLHVTAQQGESQAFRVPLVLVGIPDSLTIIHEVPEFIEVTIRGSRSALMKLRLLGRMKATVDLSLVKKGRHNITLSASMLNLSEDFDSRDVLVDNPKTLVLNFESIITKSVPVKIAYKGDIPGDIIITSQPVIIPSRVKIKGASSIVNGISVLSTEEMEIRNRKGKIKEEKKLFLGEWNVTVIPDKVLIEMEVHKKAFRTLANIPPTLLRDDGTLQVEYSPRVVSLTIEGPEDIVKNIEADDVSVILNITARTPGSYRLEPEVIVPQGVEYLLDVEVFEITILGPPAGKGSEKDGNTAKKQGGP